MKNEKKAIEISESNGVWYSNGEGSGSWSDDECYKSALEAMRWKDEQYAEEKRELLGLVKLLKVNEDNQSIIEDLIGLLQLL